MLYKNQEFKLSVSSSNLHAINHQARIEHEQEQEIEYFQSEESEESEESAHR